MKGGGSVGQSLQYVNPSAPESSASAGSDLLIQRGLIARPAIGGSMCGTRKRRGGFYPSIMSGVVTGGVVTGPLAAFTARKLLTRKNHRGGSKRGERWGREKNIAKAILSPYGKPSARNIQNFALEKRRGEEYENAFIRAYQEKKKAIAEKEKAKENRKAARLAKKQEKEETKRLRQQERLAKQATKKVKPVKLTTTTTTTTKPRTTKPATTKPAVVNNNSNNDLTPWFGIIEQAENQLKEEGVASPSAKDVLVLATLIKKGKSTESFLMNFRSRAGLPLVVSSTIAPPPTVTTVAKKTRKTNKPITTTTTTTEAPAPVATVAKKTRKTNKPATTTTTTEAPAPLTTVAKKTRKTNKPTTTTTTTTEAVAPRVKRALTEKQLKVAANLKNAHRVLSEVGKTSAENAAKYAKLKRDGANETTLSAFLANFKSRRPKKNESVKANNNINLPTIQEVTEKPNTPRTNNFEI